MAFCKFKNLFSLIKYVCSRIKDIHSENILPLHTIQNNRNMKKFFAICAVVLGILSVSSCGVSVAVMPALNETNIVLSQNNFKVIGDVQGQSQATYVLGIGGLSKKALEANAINDMINAANLKGSQTVTNIRTHVSATDILGIYNKVVITVTGTVIEFK